MGFFNNKTAVITFWVAVNRCCSCYVTLTSMMDKSQKRCAVLGRIVHSMHTRERMADTKINDASLTLYRSGGAHPANVSDSLEAAFTFSSSIRETKLECGIVAGAEVRPRFR